MVGKEGMGIFLTREKKNPLMSDKKWMQRYVYTKVLHQILFGEFPII
jgi:hypothetical protein